MHDGDVVARFVDIVVVQRAAPSRPRRRVSPGLRDARPGRAPARSCPPAPWPAPAVRCRTETAGAARDEPAPAAAPTPPGTPPRRPRWPVEDQARSGGGQRTAAEHQQEHVAGQRLGTGERQRERSARSAPQACRQSLARGRPVEPRNNYTASIMWCPSVSLSVWANAWLAGEAAPDDVLDALSLGRQGIRSPPTTRSRPVSTGLPWPDVDRLRARCRCCRRCAPRPDRRRRQRLRSRSCCRCPATCAGSPRAPSSSATP